MKKEFLNTTIETVYPGGYTPHLADSELEGFIRINAAGQALYLPVQLSENDTQFSFEVAVGGMKREDFYIRADNDDLSIRVIHPNTGIPGYLCFDQHIRLPKNADAEFSYAEYASGLLKLHIHKTNGQARDVHVRIAVY